MPRVKMEGILDQLRTEVRGALRDAVEETVKVHDGKLRYDDSELFRVFRRRIVSKCGTWARVPDTAVDPN